MINQHIILGNYNFLPDYFIAECGFDIVKVISETCNVEYKPVHRGFIYWDKDK